MSNVLLIQSSISGEQSRSQCHSLAGSRYSGDDHRSLISRTSLALAAGVAFLVAAFPPVSHAQRVVSPFAGLAGAWNGSGRIEMQNGNGERIRCRARYSVSQVGEVLVQELRCASDSYKFDVNSTSQSNGFFVRHMDRSDAQCDRHAVWTRERRLHSGAGDRTGLFSRPDREHRR